MAFEQIRTQPLPISVNKLNSLGDLLSSLRRRELTLNRQDFIDMGRIILGDDFQVMHDALQRFAFAAPPLDSVVGTAIAPGGAATSSLGGNSFAAGSGIAPATQLGGPSTTVTPGAAAAPDGGRLSQVGHLTEIQKR